MPEPVVIPATAPRRKAGRPKHPEWPLVAINVLVPLQDLRIVEALSLKYALPRADLLRAALRTGIANAHRVGIVHENGVARVAV